MQTFFRNPLAGPSVLGITSGASLGSAFVILGAGSIGLTSNLTQLGNLALILSASIGSIVVLFIILLISRIIKDQTALLIVGLMVGNLTISIVSLWQYFASPEQIKDYLLWTFGSLSNVDSAYFPIFSGIMLFCVLGAFFLSKSLNLWLMGEDYARSLGVNLNQTRLLIILLTGLATGATTAFCGIIGFLGIAVPHLARFLFDTSNHRILIPACTLIGISLLLGCDLFSKLPSSSVNLPINVITSLVGSPVVLFVILKKHKHQSRHF